MELDCNKVSNETNHIENLVQLTRLAWTRSFGKSKICETGIGSEKGIGGDKEIGSKRIMKIIPQFKIEYFVVNEATIFARKFWEKQEKHWAKDKTKASSKLVEPS